MTFCSHCGFLLAPGTTKCPRCGTPVRVASDGINTHPDAPTTKSSARPLPQDNDYQTQQMEGAMDYGTKKMGSADDVTVAARESEYMPNTPRIDESAYPLQAGHYQSRPASYPGAISSPQGMPPTTPQPRRSGNRQIIVLLSILVIVLLIAFSVLFFTSGPNPLTNLGGNTSTPTTQPTQTTGVTPQPTNAATQTPPASLEQQGRTVIEKYYFAINNKDYQTAYKLWSKTSQTYDNFVQGFTHTQRDDVVFGQIVVQSDGTVKVPLTITATSDTAAQSQFNGYYLVEQDPADGSWKIITANIRAIAGG
jgi:flagellar basal body-associated protein FliL